jgi:serine/threonine protein kinase
MTTSTSLADARDQKLNAVLLAFVQAADNGQPPDRQQFLAAHPEFAAELEEFFAGRDCLLRLTARPPEAPSAPGDLGSLGDFRLIREVGRGGMGIVYEARQLSLERHVALKVLSIAAALDARQLQRFKNEAHSAAVLHHPHIVPIYSVGCERGIHFYAMQFIEGQSLAAMIQGQRQPPGAPKDREPGTHGEQQTDGSGTLPLAIPLTVAPPRPPETPAPRSPAHAAWQSRYFRRVAELGKDAAEALEHAHQQGVVHRDIKPANILLDRQGKLWITDFGVALLQSTAGLTTTGELVGTLRYMSPEQAGGQRGLVDHRTDIYSLGATLYELATLQPPFATSDPRELLHQIATQEPRAPQALDRAIPAELEVIVLKAMAKTPAERYASAQELADDLQRFLNDQPIRARPPTLRDRALKWARRHRTAVAAALVLLVLSTIGLSASTILIARSRSDTRTAYQRERVKAEEALRNLRQARQVLDFLAEVSAAELGDRPELLPVRQKMLEGALQYYQQFVDQHQGDPSVREELDASRLRVAQILSALASQREYVLLMLEAMLLTEPAVQGNLGITSAQAEKVQALADQLKQQRQQAFQRSFARTEQERGKKLKELASANEKAVAMILTDEQGRRLKQIALQLRSPMAFTEPELAERLRLTPDQRARIQPVVEEAQRAQHEAVRSAANPGEGHKKERQAARDGEKKVLALLTPHQQAAWHAMTGTPFNRPLHFSIMSAFGARGPVPPRPPPPGEPPDGGRGPDDGGFRPRPPGPPPDGPKGPGKGPGFGPPA